MGPEDRLCLPPEQEGAPGVLGYSRWYETSGAFTWAPCFVVAYDAWVERGGMGVGGGVEGGHVRRAVAPRASTPPYSFLPPRPALFPSLDSGSS